VCVALTVFAFGVGLGGEGVLGGPLGCVVGELGWILLGGGVRLFARASAVLCVIVWWACRGAPVGGVSGCVLVCLWRTW